MHEATQSRDRLFAMYGVSLYGRDNIQAYAASETGSHTLFHGTPQSLEALGGSVLDISGAVLRPQQPYQWLGNPPRKVPFGKPAICMTPHAQFAITRSLLHHQNPVIRDAIAPGEAAINNGIQTASGEQFGLSGYDTVKALFAAFTNRPASQSQLLFRPGANGLVCFVDEKYGNLVDNYDPDERRSYVPVPIRGYGVTSPLDLPDDLLLIHGPRSTYVGFSEAAREVRGGLDELRQLAARHEVGLCTLGEVRTQWL